jgi:AcrR family transcriptional regulator
VPPASGEEAATKGMRADAMRNRQRILEAAEATFAREGLAVPVDAVAAAAGVGVGTLYRHFPTKEALFEAIVVSRLGELIEAVKAGASADPGEAFFAFLDRMADEVRLKHDLFDALSAAGIDFKSRCGELADELESGIDNLRQRAVDAGALRGDVTTPEVMGLVVGACVASRRPDMQKLGCQQMLQVVYDGLRSKTPPADEL